MNLLQKQIMSLEKIEEISGEDYHDVCDHGYQYVLQYKKQLQDLNVEGIALRDSIQKHYEEISQTIFDMVYEDGYSYSIYLEWKDKVIAEILDGYDKEGDDKIKEFEEEYEYLLKEDAQARVEQAESDSEEKGYFENDQIQRDIISGYEK